MQKLNKSQEYAVQILSALQDMLQNEDSEFYVPLEQLQEGKNLTDFFHAVSNLVPCSLYNTITNSDKNALEFNHIANQLVFQYSKNE